MPVACGERTPTGKGRGARVDRRGLSCRPTREAAQDLPLHREIARRDDAQVGTQIPVQRRQGVERHRGEGVVLGMVGHVPGEEAHDRLQDIRVRIDPMAPFELVRSTELCRMNYCDRIVIRCKIEPVRQAFI